MTPTNFDDVGNFHEKFGLRSVTHNGPNPDMPELGLVEFRIAFLTEELKEFTDAYDEENMAGMADALIDLVYVAMGTAHLMGLPWQELWDEVQQANMAKVRAAADGSNSLRGSPFDVVKPPGWEPPDIAGILETYEQ